MQTETEIKEKIAKDYGKEFWYYSYDEQQALIDVYKNKSVGWIVCHSFSWATVALLLNSL